MDVLINIYKSIDGSARGCVKQEYEAYFYPQSWRPSLVAAVMYCKLKNYLKKAVYLMAALCFSRTLRIPVVMDVAISGA